MGNLATDVHARARLAQTHSKRVWGKYGAFMTVHGWQREDLAQELELEMAQAIGKHRVDGGASLKSWLIGAMQLATQRIVERLNAKMRGKGWTRRFLYNIALNNEPSRVAENKEANEVLLRAIASIELPGRQDLQERNRRIFIDMHGLSDGVRKTPPEVANRHGISVSLAHRVSKAFKERLAVHPLVLPLAPQKARKARG